MSVSMKIRLSLLLAVVLVSGCLSACSGGAANVESSAVIETTSDAGTPPGTATSAEVSVNPAWDSQPIELTYW